jgi:acyl-CoA reductase-like NAD-dependent aldehyde dehydrogenase
MVFGGAETVARYVHDRRLEVHGPGFSKILVQGDWRPHLDVIAESVLYNGGRSCINANTVLIDGDADGLADALAARFADHVPRALDDLGATLASTDAATADALDARVTELLPGARCVTGPRRVDAHGLAWLLPTVVRCGLEHALARTELPFPFVSVVQVARAELAGALGPTLACMVLADDEVVRAVMDRPEVDRVHVGTVPTTRIRWDQPHEGNLFEASWRRRGVG